MEFLSRQEGTRLETKLQGINCFTVLAMREAEHQKCSACVNKVGILQQRVLKPVMAVNNGVLVELDATNPGLRSEMAYESRNTASEI